MATHTANSLVIEPHQLFNWVNNMFPILPLTHRATSSHRDGDEARAATLRNAVQLDLQLDAHVDASTFFKSLENACAVHRRSVGESIAVFLCDDAASVDSICSLLTNNAASNNSSAQRPASVTSLAHVGIRELRVVDFGAFHNHYCRCSGMFDGPPSDPSSRTLQPRRRLQVYYASEVVPHLFYLGDFENGQNVEQLRSLNITHIIDATNAQSSQASAAQLNLQYLAVNVEDKPDANIRQFFDVVVDFVQKSLQNSAEAPGVCAPRILFHCRAGWSRSPTLLMVCMMKLLGHSLMSALTAVLEARPNVCPNPGFCTTLVEYERELLLATAALGEATSALSFETKTDFMKHVAKLNIMWSPPMTEETDFDRMPIAASACTNYFVHSTAEDGDSSDAIAREAAIEARLEQAGAFAAAPGAVEASSSAAVSKKPFLRRGSRTALGK